LKTFKSVADLKLAKLRTGQFVETGGRYTKGDGLGSLYLIKAVSETPFDITLANGNTAVFHSYLAETATNANTFYVDNTLGSDVVDNGNAVGVNAYKTIQFAFDQLPSVIAAQQTIQLADGTYNENYIDGVDQPRPAILWGKGKSTTFRSTLAGGVLTGAIVIKGNANNRSLTVVKTGSEFNYGIYINKGNIGLQHLEIRSDGVSKASSLLVAHRTDTYIQCDDVLIDGIDVASSKFVANAVVAESGGQIELSHGCVVKNADVGCVTLTDGDNITISGDSEVNSCTTGAIITAGLLKLSMTDSSLNAKDMIHNCITAIKGVFGQIDVRGLDATHRAVIQSPIDIESSHLNLVFADTKELVTGHNGSTIKYDSSNYQKQVQLKNSNVWLRNSNSYTNVGSPNNADTIPVALLFGSTMELEGTNNIVGSAGGYASHNSRTLTFSADSDVQAIYDDTDVYRINGNGANRLTCAISSTNITDGRTIYIDGDTWGVEFTSGTDMDISTNFSVGNGTGAYTGAIFTMRNGKWRVSALGQVRV